MSQMRQSSFRFSDVTWERIERVSTQLGISQAQAIEVAIEMLDHSYSPSLPRAIESLRELIKVMNYAEKVLRDARSQLPIETLDEIMNKGGRKPRKQMPNTDDKSSVTDQ